jgi:hypothetical protein
MCLLVPKVALLQRSAIALKRARKYKGFNRMNRSVFRELKDRLNFSRMLSLKAFWASRGASLQQRYLWAKQEHRLFVQLQLPDELPKWFFHFHPSVR